jgi:hypothetical protein
LIKSAISSVWDSNVTPPCVMVPSKFTKSTQFEQHVLESGEILEELREKTPS